jgi:hypothetical protein
MAGGRRRRGGGEGAGGGRVKRRPAYSPRSFRKHTDTRQKTRAKENDDRARVALHRRLRDAATAAAIARKYDAFYRNFPPLAVFHLLLLMRKVGRKNEEQQTAKNSPIPVGGTPFIFPSPRVAASAVARLFLLASVKRSPVLGARRTPAFERLSIDRSFVRLPAVVPSGYQTLTRRSKWNVNGLRHEQDL